MYVCTTPPFTAYASSTCSTMVDEPERPRFAMCAAAEVFLDASLRVCHSVRVGSVLHAIHVAIS